MKKEYEHDSILIVIEDKSLRKGVTLSLLLFFSNISVPTSDHKTSTMIKSKQFDYAIFDQSIICNDKQLIRKLVKDFLPRTKIILLLFNQDNIVEELFEKSEKLEIVFSVDELISKIKGTDK